MKHFELTPNGIYSSEKAIASFATEAARHSHKVAAIAVSSLYVEAVAVAIEDKDIAIVAVLGSGAYNEVKMLECAMAIENGADEIEAELNLGELQDKQSEKVMAELIILREEIADDALFSVSIRPIKDEDISLINEAVDIAIKAGADTIKLSLENCSKQWGFEVFKTICSKITHDKTVKITALEEDFPTLKTMAGDIFFRIITI